MELSKLPYIVACINATIFGFSFLFTKGGLDYLTRNQLLASRFFLAAAALTLLWACGVIRIDLRNKPIKKALLLALVEPILYFSFETIGVQLTTSSEAGIMTALIPVVVTILGAIFLREHPSIAQVGCIILSVIGVLFVVLGGQGNLPLSGHGLGLLALGGAVLSSGFFNILSRHLSRQFRPIELTYVMMCTSALFFGALTIGEHVMAGNLQEFFAPYTHPQTWVAILYLGLLSSLAAFFGVNYVLSKLEASKSAVFANLTTVISIAAGVVFRGEPLFWYHLVGGALILIGVWGTNRFSRKAKLITTPVSSSTAKPA